MQPVWDLHLDIVLAVYRVPEESFSSGFDHVEDRV
jgi:hypothetical protein